MRKQKVLFLCTQNSARSQMAEASLKHHAGDRFEAYSAGVNPGEGVHPYAVEAMREVGIDISEQYPKGLRTYMGKVGFNYSIIVCARVEKDCPKTFPGVGTRLIWLFDEPRCEDVPEEEMLGKFREIRDEIQLKIKGWLEHPEAELTKLRAERERRERLEAAQRAREPRLELEVVPESSRRPHPTTSREALVAPGSGA
jgi:arsenate reductase